MTIVSIPNQKLQVFASDNGMSHCRYLYDNDYAGLDSSLSGDLHYNVIIHHYANNERETLIAKSTPQAKVIPMVKDDSSVLVRFAFMARLNELKDSIRFTVNSSGQIDNVLTEIRLIPVNAKENPVGKLLPKPTDGSYPWFKTTSKHDPFSTGQAYTCAICTPSTPCIRRTFPYEVTFYVMDEKDRLWKNSISSSLDFTCGEEKYLEDEVINSYKAVGHAHSDPEWEDDKPYYDLSSPNQCRIEWTCP
ncbi:MAG: hypothetical protein H7A35_15160 [Planctomycetales bacterium]|nr:MAG: hypothetical protein H7A35_15160 [Planctomycetales bacterium]